MRNDFRDYLRMRIIAVLCALLVAGCAAAPGQAIPEVNKVNGALKIKDVPGPGQPGGPKVR